MKVNKYSMSDGVIDIHMEKEKECLSKMYPGVNIQDKYVLFLQADLWFPFHNDEVEANIIFNHKQEHKTHPYKIRTPYPNKSIFQASMIKNRKVSNLGIPVLFDTYEELLDLISVDITWKISYFDDYEEVNVMYVKIHYDLEFEYEEGKRVYCLHTKDNPMDAFTLMKDKDYFQTTLENYYNEFDMMLYMNINNEDMSYNVIKGDMYDNDEAIIEEIMSTITVQDIVSTVDGNEIEAYSYKAKVKLIPNKIGTNLCMI